MAAHTKGPWRVFTPETYEGPKDLPGLGIENEDGTAVVWYAADPDSGLQNDADAYLIAAAPDLLECARLARHICEDGNALQQMLDAAIAKATQP